MNDVTDGRATYKVVIEKLSEEDGGGFLATVPELPGCMCRTARPAPRRSPMSRMRSRRGSIARGRWGAPYRSLNCIGQPNSDICRRAVGDRQVPGAFIDAVVAKGRA